ncbi:UDP-N-acetyl-D-mannosamine dehydrogenase [Sanguibacter sp. A247]|uniref:UDP-N-acetyl-D-mannosamine dehydrogenase n=1 Tax=unclassified Sanguibacter TaxID=2645534 RepID=UPI003FD877A1
MITDTTVVVMGLGYIGLPTAAILSSKGVRVHGVDVNQHVIDAVNAGTVPFVEPDLGGYVQQAVAAGTLSASLEPITADHYVIAVPTPFLDDRTPDLGYIKAAAEKIAPTIKPGALVILESTSPPHATQQMSEWILDARPDLINDEGEALVHFAHCPERVLPGRVMVELVTNDRIVGGITPRAAELAKELYEVFCEGEILLTDDVTAEMAKLTENSFRDVNIAFANELSLICDDLGIDVWELIELANHHPRVNILQPGPGVGGHCIAVDPWFIVAANPERSRIIRTAREINDAKPGWVLDKVTKAVAGNEAPVITLLGLAFKPNIDDLRESPARKIAATVADEFPHASVRIVEPHIEELPKELGNRKNVTLAPLDDNLEESDCVVLLVDHNAFKALDRPQSPTVVDTRGMWR